VGEHASRAYRRVVEITQLIIQNVGRDLYLDGAGQWTQNRGDAKRFESASGALKCVEASGLNEQSARIVWKSPVVECDWEVWPGRRAGTTS
jgi:hypothetical protein